MPDEMKPQDGTPIEKPQPEKTGAEPKKSAPVDSGSSDGSDVKTFDASYVKELRDEAAGWRKQFRELEKRLNEHDNEKQKKVDTELAENNKWRELAEKREKDLAAITAERDAERAANLRNKVGIEFKLSPSQIKRLQGATEDELRADAEELVKDLGLDKKPDPAPDPKATSTQQTGATSQSRRQTTAVAPDGQALGETDQQRRDRLYKRGAVNSPLFSNRSNNN